MGMDFGGGYSPDEKRRSSVGNRLQRAWQTRIPLSIDDVLIITNVMLMIIVLIMFCVAAVQVSMQPTNPTSCRGGVYFPSSEL